VIEGVAAPFDHKFPVAEEDVRTTLPPAQNVVELAAVIVGAEGIAFTVTLTGADAGETQPADVTVAV